MIDTCVCCGEYVPESRMICPTCEKKYEEKDGDNNNRYGSFNLEQLRHRRGMGSGTERRISENVRRRNRSDDL